MAKRKPFELNGVLIVYNFGMVLLSMYMFKEVCIANNVLWQLRVTLCHASNFYSYFYHRQHLNTIISVILSTMEPMSGL